MEHKANGTESHQIAESSLSYSNTVKSPILQTCGDGLNLPKSQTGYSEPNSDNTLKENTGLPVYIYVLAFFAALGGFLFGYDTGVISGAMLLLKTNFELNNAWKEAIVSITVGAAILGALSGGWFTEKFGRKPVLLVSSIIFTAGAILMGVANTKETLLIGRGTVGVAIGYASSTVPMYISEAAPANARGRLGTLYQLFITFGICCASITDGLFSKNTENGWRYMLGLAGIPAVIMLVGFLFMPESPRWLVTKDKLSAARTVLRKLRGNANIESELQSIVDSFNATKKQAVGNSCSTISRVCKTYYTRRALIIGCGLQAFQQLCGINTVIYYSATIIKNAGVSENSIAIWFSSLVASCNFIFTVVAMFFVEKLGRRRLVLGSLFGVIIGLVIIGSCFVINSNPVKFRPVLDSCSHYSACYTCIDNLKANCGFCYVDAGSGGNRFGSCLVHNGTHQPQACGPTIYNRTMVGQLKWSPSSCPVSYAWITVVGLIFYLAVFAPGMGPMPWVINSEIYPLWARTTGVSCSTATNWLFNVLVAQTFLDLMDYLTPYGAFFIYSGISLLGWVFIYLLLPDTKDKPLEEVEGLFKGPLIIPFRKEKEMSHVKYENI